MNRSTHRFLLAGLSLALVSACGDDGPTSSDEDTDSQLDVGSDLSDTAEDTPNDSGTDTPADSADAVPDAVPDAETDTTDVGPDTDPLRFVAVTFNTGSGANPSSDEENAGFGPEQSTISDDYYGNGLAWPLFIEQTRDWIAANDVDVIGFQEIFWPGECDEIPEELHAGFICETWEPGDPLVVELVLGPDWQIACHPNSPDKCVGVRRSFGSFVGCEEDLCIEGMRGFPIEGCSNRARIASGEIALADGSGSLTVVNFHGTSGFEASDRECRVKQVEAVFVDAGDGAPLVGDGPNLILGDLNTDPGRFTASDPSAGRWLDFVGGEHAFQFVTDVGQDALPTYTLFNIDHVISDAATGSCWHAGITEDRAPVLEYVYYDHVPAVCALELPR